MKPLLITGLLMVAAYFIQAQTPTVTVYGFRQHISPGTQKAGDIDENGTFIKKEPAEQFHYTIYLATSSKAEINPIQLWINGKAFSVHTEPVTKTPVTTTDKNTPAGKVKPLIPQTTGTILKLTPALLVDEKGNNQARDLAKTNAVVVLYQTGGKLRYGVLKKFTDLAPVSLQ